MFTQVYQPQWHAGDSARPRPGQKPSAGSFNCKHVRHVGQRDTWFILTVTVSGDIFAVQRRSLAYTELHSPAIVDKILKAESAPSGIPINGGFRRAFDLHSLDFVAGLSLLHLNAQSSE